MAGIEMMQLLLRLVQTLARWPQPGGHPSFLLGLPRLAGTSRKCRCSACQPRLALSPPSLGLSSCPCPMSMTVS